MTIVDIHYDITSNRLSRIDTATIEIGDISIINLPMYVAVNHLLGSSCYLIKASTTDVALSVILLNSCIRSIDTRQIETVKVTTCHRYWNMLGKTKSVTMSTITKCFEPSITTQVDILCLSRNFLTLGRSELVKNTSKEDDGGWCLILTIVSLKLHEVYVAGVGNLKPPFGLKDTHI